MLLTIKFRNRMTPYLQKGVMKAKLSFRLLIGTSLMLASRLLIKPFSANPTARCRRSDTSVQNRRATHTRNGQRFDYG